MNDLSLEEWGNWLFALTKGIASALKENRRFYPKDDDVDKLLQLREFLLSTLPAQKTASGNVRSAGIDEERLKKFIKEWAEELEEDSSPYTFEGDLFIDINEETLEKMLQAYEALKEGGE